jgi:hypothetical protein
MPINYRVLGQVSPPASGLTTLYTVPSGTQTICSTLSVCNLAGFLNTYRIAVRPTGAAIVNQHYIVYDAQVAGNDSNFLTLGLSLNSGDVLSVYTPSNSGLSFNVFGSEIS